MSKLLYRTKVKSKYQGVLLHPFFLTTFNPDRSLMGAHRLILNAMFILAAHIVDPLKRSIDKQAAKAT